MNNNLFGNVRQQNFWGSVCVRIMRAEHRVVNQFAVLIIPADLKRRQNPTVSIFRRDNFDAIGVNHLS